MGRYRDEIAATDAALTASLKALDDISAKARAQGTKLGDDWDAYMTQAIRRSGGSPRAAERRVRKYLKKRGY
jgi:hypothetical protein